MGECIKIKFYYTFHITVINPVHFISSFSKKRNFGYSEVRVLLHGLKLWLLCVNVQQISSFRESKSDDRRFYIFTATKTLHLRTDSREDRVAWIQALVSTRGLYPLQPLNDNLSLAPSDMSVSTERLKTRLLKEGTDENLVKECEQIMLSEFSRIQGQLEVLCQERSNLLDTIRQLEVIS